MGSMHRGLGQAACFLLAVAVVAAPWLLRNQVCFGQPFLTRFAGRSFWWSCFKGSPQDWLDPPIPFGSGPATNLVLGRLQGVDPHNAWATYHALRERGYSQIEADNLMLRASQEAIRRIPGST